ncbi:molecular chaperone DnaJ [Asticcacaulis sp. EMRT-3]|uniref:J domain-containing protein n=1 Tax=Asticcacaulis sp. EMRT-3 TaxID=3040349 RepID=UPI0024AF5D83|nr:molecular chaperone DnaJ [Asticcacaulis sp. EMRT-3]MDI7774211.1 molecular chaperone DnaJ [Asticcacaulis sp. EMRT-3]
MWLALIAVAFLIFVYIGRQARLGRLKPAPWIRQFRAVRSVIGVGLSVFGITLLVRGLLWEGVIAILIGMGMMGTVRFQAAFRRPQGPPVAAAYSQDEIRAYAVLDLAVGADRKAIREAWKRKMKTAHPDQGGSGERAQALNAARDILLRRRGV